MCITIQAISDHLTANGVLNDYHTEVRANTIKTKHGTHVVGNSLLLADSCCAIVTYSHQSNHPTLQMFEILRHRGQALQITRIIVPGTHHGLPKGTSPHLTPSALTKKLQLADPRLLDQLLEICPKTGTLETWPKS